MICSDWCGEKRPYRRGPWIERGTALRSVGVESRLRGIRYTDSYASGRIDRIGSIVADDGKLVDFHPAGWG